eukprot:8889247-Ditylum_brightwellii.AAC.1
MGDSRAKPMLSWLNQGKPSDRGWIMWRRFLKKCFAPATSKSHILNKPIKLHQQLGEWTTSTPYTARQYYYAFSTNKVNALKQGMFHAYKLTFSWVTWFHATNQTCTELPEDAISCT